MIVKTVLLLVVLTLDVATGGRIPTAARYHTATTKTPPIRGGKPRNRNDLVPIHRKLLPMHHGHGGSSYLGCLNYTSEELEEEWIFPGNAPNCSYVSHGYDDGDDDGNAAGENGDNDENGNYNAEGGDGDAEGDGADNNYDGSGNNDDYDGNGGGNGNNGGNDGNGQGGYNGDRGDEKAYDDSGYVVTNEDIANGNYGNENPMESFNISECNTYDNLWVWDLALSCESDLSLEDCECTFTEQLMQEGMLQCDDIISCPKDCQVCKTCLTLVGCTPVPADNIFVRSGTSASTLFAICAAIGLFLFGIGYYYCRNKNNADENALEAQLIDKKLQDSIQKIPSAEKDQKDVGFYNPEFEIPLYSDIPDFRSDLSSLASNSQTDESETSIFTSDGQGVTISEVELSPSHGADATPGETHNNVGGIQKTEDISGTLAKAAVGGVLVSDSLGAAVVPDTAPTTTERFDDTINANETCPPPISTASNSANASPKSPLPPLAVFGDPSTAKENTGASELSRPVVSNLNSAPITQLLIPPIDPRASDNSNIEDSMERPVTETHKAGTARKSSNASDASPSDDSVSPWIGDIDLSNTEPPSFDDNDKQPSKAEENDDKVNDVPGKINPVTPSQNHGGSDIDDGSPTEPTSVWLVPLDDLDEAFLSNYDAKASSANPVTPESAAEPSIVWLAPSSSPAELAPEKKDDSSSVSSWDPDTEGGPWLAPI